MIVDSLFSREDFIKCLIFVPRAGLEPARLTARDFKSLMSTDSITRAGGFRNCKGFLLKILSLRHGQESILTESVQVFCLSETSLENPRRTFTIPTKAPLELSLLVLRHGRESNPR